MALGRIETSILTDIANAIRYKNGTSALLKPGQMAAAVAALDGTDAGGYVEQPYKELESGVLSDNTLTDIANAIRAQNGSSTVYKPSEMAAAIRALEWTSDLKVRAVLTDDGVLEINYFDTVRTRDNKTVAQSFEVDVNGYTSASARPWDAIKTQVTSARIDQTIENLGITDCSYWFSGFSNLVSLNGFDFLNNLTTATQMFSSCTSLESIYITGSVEYECKITSGTNMFYGCNKLVGGSGSFVASSVRDYTICNVTRTGVLTDPYYDNRKWAYFYLYDNGELVVTTSYSPDSTRTLLASGRLCMTANYQTSGVNPVYAKRSDVSTVTFPSLSATDGVNLDYWFYGMSAINSFSGLANLNNVKSMRYAFSGCTGITELDFRRFDPSYLTDLFYAFSGCTNLQTIYASSSWVLPDTASGSGTFYNCTSLVGGNGTAYASNKITYDYFRIDVEGTEGYLTAG